MNENSQDQFIDYSVAHKVAHIRVERPKYRNAQSRILLEQLDQAFMRADQDPKVNVVVLSGAGEHFSAGHDLGTPQELQDREERPWRDGVRGWYERTYDIFFANTLRWRNISKPSVSAVQGYCIFGGWMIASATDCIFAADNAMFLGSHFQYFSLPWDLHPRKAKEILFESRFVDAQEAMQMGLVNRVYAADELLDQTLGWAQRVAENDPFLLRMSKLAVNQAQETQGFTAHTTAAHALYTLARLGEYDPDSYIADPNAKRRPMVQVALDNYRRNKAD